MIYAFPLSLRRFAAVRHPAFCNAKKKRQDKRQEKREEKREEKLEQS
jgi:hypothetical protein